MRKPATIEEKEHMALVKQLLCIICNEDWFDDTITIGATFYGGTPNMSEFDHLVDGKRLGHFYGLPLCKRHHEGKKHYGAPSYFWDASKPNQWRLLEKVYKVLGKEIPPYNPKINNFK